MFKLPRFLSDMFKTTVLPTGEKRASSVSNFTLAEPSQEVLDMFGFNSSSNITVTEAKALGLPALYAAIKIKADSVASLPFNVYREDDLGNRQLGKKHPVNKLIAYRPYKYLTSYQFKWTMQALLELRGNAVAHIERHQTTYRPLRLKILKPSSVRIEEFENGDLWYYWEDHVTGKSHRAPYLDIIHLKKFSLDGIKGQSIINLGKNNLALAIAAQDFEAKFFSNNAHVDGFLSHPEKIVKKQKSKIAKSWSRWQQGIANAFRTPILEGGMTYHKIGSNPEEALLTESKKLSIEDISRWTGVPMYRLSVSENLSYNSVEHFSRDYYNNCLVPETLNWKGEFDLKMFREDEMYNTNTDFDFSDLLKGDMEKLSEYVRTLFNAGMINQDEGRRKIGLNALNTEESKKYWLQLNMAPTDKKERKGYLKNKSNTKNSDKTPQEGIKDK